MTAIFISHASGDRAQAAAMRKRLHDDGHSSLFLDFDAEAGIRAGADWEQTLYRRLGQCQAVVALISPAWLDSKWCFAEVVQARASGKPVFPVIVAPCPPAPVLADIQHIDLTVDPEDGYRRLALGLLEHGLDPSKIFTRVPGRPPYPGLLAFQKEDAAVFFGRNQEVVLGLETLEQLRHRGRDAPRLLLLLGASGSGKSSLARAGLIPRLEREPASWLPLPPLIPGTRPLDLLADTLGAKLPRERIAETLSRTAGSEPDGFTLLRLADEARVAAGQPGATVLICLDQAEELFGLADADEAGRFLRLLRAALEESEGELMVLATMRSDVLGAFQTHPVLQDPAYPHPFAYRTLQIDPIAPQAFREIIQGPAGLAGIELEEGLVEAMVADADTGDALPLLAYVLHRLWRLARERGGRERLTVADYEALGRLTGAVMRSAERVLDEVKPSPAQLDALRAAFLPHLVRIDEHGRHLRRRAFRDLLPAAAAPLLDRLVDARLLVTDRDRESGRETIEVAHEALLRTWPLLTDWLREDELLLRQHQSLQRAAADWQAGGRRRDLLVHRGGRLEDARALNREERFAPPAASIERAYLGACVAAARWRRWTTVGGVSLAFAIVLGFALFAQSERNRAEAERTVALAERDRAYVAESRRLAGIAGTLEPELAVLLARHALIGDLADPQTRPYTWEAGEALVRALEPYGRLDRFLPHPGDALVAFLDDERVLTAASDGTWAVWDASSGEPLVTIDEASSVPITATDLGRDGSLLLTAFADGLVRLWDTATGDQLQQLVIEHEEHLFSAALDAAGEHVVTASRNGLARVWRIESGEVLRELEHDEDLLAPVDAALFAARDARIVTAAYGTGIALVWDEATHLPIGEPIPYRSDRPYEPGYLGLALAADRVHVVVPDGEAARIVDARTAEVIAVHDGVPPELVAVAAGAGGLQVTAVPEERMGVVWAVLADNELAGLATGDVTLASPLSPGRSRLLTRSDRTTAVLWDVGTRNAIGRLAIRDVVHASFSAFSADGARLVTGSGNSAAIWDAHDNSPAILFDVLAHEPYADTVAAHCRGAGAQLVTAGSRRYGHELRVWDTERMAAVTIAGPFPGLYGHLSPFGFSPDGSIMIEIDWTRRAGRGWDTRTGGQLSAELAADRLTTLGDEDSILPLAEAAHGGLIAMARNDAVELRGTKTPVVLRGHGGEVRGAGFDSDGTRIVTAAADKTARVWETATGRLIDILRHEAPVLCAAFDDDGTHVATADEHGTVRRWALERQSFEDVLALARRAVPRDLTDAEKAAYAIALD